MRQPAMVALAFALSVSSASAQLGNQLVVSLDGGSLTVNGRPLAEEDLEALLRDVFRTRSDKTLFLRATGEAHHGQVVRVVDSASSAGVTRVVLAATGLGDEAGLAVELGSLRQLPAPVRLPRARYAASVATPSGLVFALESAPPAAELLGELEGRRGAAAKVWVVADAETPWSRLRELLQVCREGEATALVLVVEGDGSPAGGSVPPPRGL